MKNVKFILSALFFAFIQLSIAQGTAKPVTASASANTRPVSPNPGKASTNPKKPDGKKAPRSIHISGKAPKLQKKAPVTKK